MFIKHEVAELVKRHVMERAPEAPSLSAWSHYWGPLPLIPYPPPHPTLETTIFFPKCGGQINTWGKTVASVRCKELIFCFWRAGGKN